ncbi:hypothetical protein KJ974_03295 [bacterium]|nr:hypothetical protein [bacterium]
MDNWEIGRSVDWAISRLADRQIDRKVIMIEKEILSEMILDYQKNTLHI